MDWLVIWGVTQTVGFVFGAVMEDLAKDTLKDYVKDFFKGRLQGLVDRFGSDSLETETGKAIKGFLDLVQRELEDCCDDELERVQAYAESLKRLIADPAVAGVLGSVFTDGGQVDPVVWADRWLALRLQPLPPEFNWQKIAKRYQKYTRELIGADEKLRAIAQFELVAETRDLVRGSLGPIVDFDLLAYARSLQTDHEVLPLDQLATDGGAYSVKLWQVFLPQRARECGEYLPQLDKAPKELLRQYGLLKEELDENQQERLRDLYRNQAPQSVVELVKNPNMNLFVILGDPGSGKSTLLKYLALDWATYENELFKTNHTQPSDQLLLRPLPLFVELRKLSRQASLDVLDYFHAGNVLDRLNKSQLHDWLSAGRVLLLFDGLDEVFEPARRDEVIREICRLAHDYPAAKIIVTSRVYGYQNYARSLTNHGFRHWLLEEFDDQQIKDFCDRWHQETFGDGQQADCDRCRDRMSAAIARGRTIRELAGNPLMLTMMCILNRKSRLPDERLEFYRQATDLLLRDWDVEHKKLPDRCQDIQLTLNQKQKIVRQVAFFLQNTDGGLKGNLIAQADLQAIVADYLRTLSLPNPEGWAEALIDALRVRNFTLCSAGTGYYAFVHRTFLEYFCATEIWERFNQRDSGSQNAISTDDLIHTIFGQHWNDDAWREVLILLASQLPIGFAKQAIASLVQLDHATSEKADFANLFLAADCLAELPERSAIAELDRDLLQRLRSLTTWGQLQKDHIQKGSDCNRRIWNVRTKSVKYIARHWSDDPGTLPLLKEQLHDLGGWTIKEVVVEYIAQHWADDPNTLPTLKEWVCNEQNLTVRQLAVQTIAHYWSNHPDTLPMIKEWMCDEKDWDVRFGAVVVIAQHWSNDPDTLPMLKERAEIDQSEEIREAAVEAVIQNWVNDLDILAWLKERAKVDDSSDVRQTIMDAIIQFWKDDPDTLSWLKEQAKPEPNWGGWYVAMDAIINHWGDHPDTLPWLKEQVYSEKESGIQYVAVKVIAKHWKDSPDTLALLKKWVQTNKNWFVRQAAVEAITQHWPDDPSTLKLLDKVAIQDPFQRSRQYERNPRKTALEGLLEIVPKNPLVIDLLRDRAANDPDDLLRQWATEQLANIDPQ
ncbi:HEAT repeat domain-containing protein [Limnothrix sp. FACHB-1083]|nr:HEAT repeat domain-containing protein [Limnothrix sp. FACHB-1083]